ncbi:GNAT family N-acetyltransferase [Dyadobacter sp. LHD-138]|uniref:GNAT family N-acetyltransferase n=1 Tax=Dyadobacter sp. LHD-138 TaxID=3071413 RepID=UPI0027DF0852|nr:GNAT family N-acetyltransferase [Dyadobacter sp. LHD-138]MDQ6477635.1 GNAT family N-acetyltransferase [Dyadobacter sp. LHD-138]
MEYKYRIATHEDMDGLQKLGLNAYGQFKEVLTDENWIKLHASLTNENMYPNLLAKSVCYVCETGEDIIGMAFFISNGNPTDIFQADWAYVRMVGVHTAFGGNGIGKRLMEKCIERARETGEKIIALHTSEFMDAARHIYENMGFKQARQLEAMLGKRYWLYLLEL